MDKLLPKSIGPCTVIEKRNPLFYVIEVPKKRGSKLLVCHVSRMKLVPSDPPFPDLEPLEGAVL